MDEVLLCVAAFRSPATQVGREVQRMAWDGGKLVANGWEVSGMAGGTRKSSSLSGWQAVERTANGGKWSVMMRGGRSDGTGSKCGGWVVSVVVSVVRLCWFRGLVL